MPINPGVLGMPGISGKPPDQLIADQGLHVGHGPDVSHARLVFDDGELQSGQRPRADAADAETTDRDGPEEGEIVTEMETDGATPLYKIPTPHLTP